MNLFTVLKEFNQYVYLIKNKTLLMMSIKLSLCLVILFVAAYGENTTLPTVEANLNLLYIPVIAQIEYCGDCPLTRKLS